MDDLLQLTCRHRSISRSIDAILVSSPGWTEKQPTPTWADRMAKTIPCTVYALTKTNAMFAGQACVNGGIQLSSVTNNCYSVSEV